MSLINKMLQDLDARGGGAEAAVQAEEVKAVPPAERDRRPLLIGGAALGVLVVAAAGWYGWQYWQSHSAPPAAPTPRIVDNRAPNKPRSQEPYAAASSTVPALVEQAHAPLVAAPTASPLTASAPAASASPAAAAPQHVAEGPAAKPSRVAAERAQRAEHDDAAATDASPRTRKAAPVPSAAPADGMVLRELTPKQISENSYRRALTALQEGRVSAALADLDKAVEVDPRNDAARQTYVSLLMENRRTDDAIRQLRLALGIEPRQPGLAMVLARLQLEKGGPALDTLLKTLPYAANNADYQAFLAGVLQREQRHAEAAGHYRNALAIAPGNAVWWMGLGISLQADQHLPEAREAYTQARSGAGLTPELKSFIDRKLDQLSR